MVAPCPRPSLPPFSPRDCASDPGITGIIPKRGSPDCNLIKEAPEPCIIAPTIGVIPPIIPPPAFGCFIPFTETNLTEGAGGIAAELAAGTVAGSTDPCDEKLTLNIEVPPFVFDPTLNPPCGSLGATAGTVDGGTAAPSLAASVNAINTEDFGCNRNIGVTITLPSLVFDMDCAATWPEFLDCKLEAEDWVTILGKLSVEDWEGLLAGVDLGGGGGGGGLVVKVVGHVSGRTYLVDVYGDGQDRAATESSVEAIQLQLDDTLDTIPNDTWAIATEVTREVEPPTDPVTEETIRYFQVPIWLGPTV